MRPRRHRHRKASNSDPWPFNDRFINGIKLCYLPYQDRILWGIVNPASRIGRDTVRFRLHPQEL